MIDDQESAAFSSMRSSLIGYFQRVIGLTLSTNQWPLSSGLPMSFTMQYRFLTSTLQDREVLFVFSKFEREGYELRRHAERVQRIYDGIIIYVLLGGTTRLRNDLISLKIPFVIPGYQMYLPCFFMDLREAAKKRGEVYLQRNKKLSPAAQVLALKLLGLTGDEALETASICDWAGFSKMTVSKAMRELSNFSCVRIVRQQRSNAISLLGNKKDAWIQLVDALKSPISKIYFMQMPLAERLAECVVAGEQALAIMSMLGDPELGTYACSKSVWAILSERGSWSDSPAEFENNNLAYCRIEVWAYDPVLLSETGVIDVGSLYLSLRSDPDERVQGELEAVINNFIS